LYFSRFKDLEDRGNNKQTANVPDARRRGSGSFLFAQVVKKFINAKGENGMGITRRDLHKIRKALGLTLDEMGALMNVSGPHLHYIEKGSRPLRGERC
jgi:DNA-binding transcriptional regulator YiaG